MGDTHHRPVYHADFGTSCRRPFIDAALESKLHAYIVGIVAGERGLVMAIGGIEDHVHILMRLRSDHAPANIVKNVKSNSSKWVHGEFRDRAEFRWQRGYGIFTVSCSQEEAASAYILNQRKNHQSRGYKEEYDGLLNVHRIEYDPAFVWELDDEPDDAAPPSGGATDASL